MQTNRVLYDGLFTFVFRILNVGAAAGLGILTARLLGPAGKGIYALPSVEAGLVVSAFSGLGSSLSYFLLNRSTGRGVFRPAFLTALLFTAAGAAAIIPIALLARQWWTVIPAMLSLPAAAGVNIASGYAIGMKRVRYSTTVNVSLTVVTFVFMAAGLFLAGRNAHVAIAMWLISSWIVAIVAVSAVFFHARKLQGQERVSTVEYARFSFKVGMVNLVSLLNYRADLYIVALLTSAASLGMYTVAVSAAESLLVPTQVAALVTSPHIGSLERSEAARLTARCVRNNMLVALIVCGVLFAFAAPVVHLLYGRAFSPAIPVLQVLLIGVFALSLGSPMSSYFTLKLGRPEVPLWLASGAAAICIAVSLALVPSLGMLGAAIGSSAAYFGGQIAATWYFSRLTKIGPVEILVPTRADLAIYRAFAAKVLVDARSALGPTT